MKYADLHVHTSYSDSTFSPEEVMACAQEKGLDAIAICDHDSVEGVAPSIEIGKRLGIEVIPGVEMTVEKSDTEVHLLGYFVNYKDEWFKEILRELRDWRVKRVYTMAEKLKAEGITIDPEEVFKLSKDGSVGRLHVAQVMVNAGKVKRMKEAFDRYIGFSKPCYVPSVRFAPEEAIRTLIKAGGVPVLAHPGIMFKDEYIGELISYGLRGIEVYHSDHNAAAVKHYEEVADSYGLLMTGGSDCHGMGKGRVLMGNIKVPYELVERLKEECGKTKIA
jgi:predicted metal-dependent phosphoesterase TrpH